MGPAAGSARGRRGVGVAMAVAVAMLGSVTAPAYASESGWAISSASSPTNFAPADKTGDDTYVIDAIDTGSGSAGGGRIEVVDTLPAGLAATSISGEDLGNGQALSCKLTPAPACTYEGYEVAPGDVLRVTVVVNVEPGAVSPAVNSVTVSGGGAATAATSTDPTTISSTAAGFGITGFAASWSGTEAGASANLTAGFTLNQIEANGEYQPAAPAKDVELELPPGVFANARTLPRCPLSEAVDGGCEEQAAVGVLFASPRSPVGGPPTPYSSLIYNAPPEPGEPAAFMFKLAGVWVRVATGISAGDDYRMRLRVENVPQFAGLLSMEMTLWGVPGAYNNPAAGPDHVLSEAERDFGSPGAGGTARFLTSGGACESPVPTSTLSADSWTQPGMFDEASSTSPPWTGCNRLSFDPALSVAPDISEADEPSGYELDLHIPQAEDPEGLSSAELRDVAVTLPEGAAVSLSAADGLQTCSEAQVGLGSPAPATCPEAAKVGQAAVLTPLLANPLEGAVYMATPNENPFDSPLALYIVAEDPVSGVLVKLASQLEPNPVTGQLTIVLRELPQLPISGVQLHFFGGERALLTTPATCGLATSTSELTPWSGNTGVMASSAFEVDLGPNGTPCSQSRPFSPTFQAGSTATGEVDAYGSLTLLVTRADQEAQLGTIAIQAPPAVAQMFAGVPPCGEPQAAQGTCPADSEIGIVAARAGPGPDPASLNGTVYLTGPYGGASQGLSIALPVTSGPFELGTVVVRASEQIDPQSGQMMIASDRLPSVVDGVPLQLKALLLKLDRGEFRIDPDGCEPLTVTGTITSTQGGSVKIPTEPLGASASPCPPHQSSLPAATPPAGDVSSSGSVSLAGTRITTSRGEATIKLRCAGVSTCHGKLTLTSKTRGKKRRSRTTTIGTAAFSVPPGKTAAIALRLNPAGRTLLSADHGRLSAALIILKSSPAPSQTHTENVHLVRQLTAKPRKPKQ
jgi:hypothetical protein